MGWEFVVVVMGFVAFIQWDEKRFTLRKFIKESTIISLFVFMFYKIFGFVGDKIADVVPNFWPKIFPGTSRVWFGAAIFFLLTCTLSYKAIKHSKELRNNEDERL